MTMRKPRDKPKAPNPEPCLTVEQTPDQVRAILWAIAANSELSPTSRVNACRLLLMDFRERGDDGESRQDTDLNRRALDLMRKMAN